MSASEKLCAEAAGILISQLGGRTVEMVARTESGDTDLGIGVCIGGRVLRVGDLLSALLAAAQRPVMRDPTDDKKVGKFLDGAVGAIEATSAEYSLLWDRLRNEVSWDSNLSGMMLTIGELAGCPVSLSLHTAVVGGRKIVFYNACSQVVDHKMVREWMDRVLPDVPHTDADNAYSVLSG